MFPRLTHDCEVDLGLPGAQLALHHQCVAATVLLARCQDGELAAALAVLHLDVLALLDLQVEAGVKKGAPPLSIPKGGQDMGEATPLSIPTDMGEGAGVGPFCLLWCISVMPLLGMETEGCLVLADQSVSQSNITGERQANKTPCLKGGGWLA